MQASTNICIATAHHYTSMIANWRFLTFKKGGKPLCVVIVLGAEQQGRIFAVIQDYYNTVLEVTLQKNHHPHKKFGLWYHHYTQLGEGIAQTWTSMVAPLKSPRIGYLGHPAECLASGLVPVGSTQLQYQAVLRRTFCGVSLVWHNAAPEARPARRRCGNQKSLF
jgi:hypothetical protein